MALTETVHNGEFILAESEGSLSRDVGTVTVATGKKYLSGRVLGQLSGSGKYVAYDNVGTDGSEEAAAILYNECDNSDGVAPVDFEATVVNLNAEVALAKLSWETGASAGDKTAALADLRALGIKARS
jgi:hypothetical protein